MRRASVLVAVAAAVLVGAVALGRSARTTAQDATPGATAGHPLVGTWVVWTDEPPATPSVTAFGADGTAVDGCCGGAARVGTWRATGPRSADVTLVLVLPGGDGRFAGSVTIRASLEVEAGGEALARPYSYTQVAADGTVVETGGGMTRGARLEAEPAAAAGTPPMALPTWTPATPEAQTPAAATPAA